MNDNKLNLFVRGSIFEEDIFSISEYLNCEQLKELEELLILEGLDISKVFVINTAYPKYWYIDEPSFIPIPILSKECISKISLSKILSCTQKELINLWETQNFISFFSKLQSRFRFYYFLKMYREIPDEYKYSIFRFIYTRADYGFNRVNPEIITEIFSYNNDKSFKDKLIIDKDGYVEIYRGEGMLYSSVKEAYSWSTDLKTAILFGKRNGELRHLYKAKIHIDDIVDYIDNRGESEVLLSYKNIVSIEEIKEYELSELLKNEYIVNNYNKFNKLIKPELFLSPYNIHGIHHAKRVLMLSCLYSFIEKLSESELNILALASVYHDIGRVDEGVCLVHGNLSVAKINNLKLLESCGMNLSEEDKMIIEDIISLHCVQDSQAFNKVMETTTKDKEKALRLLKIFKDMDNLDRVRLGDLDIRYLRNDTSLLLSDTAYEIYYSNDILD